MITIIFWAIDSPCQLLRVKIIMLRVSLKSLVKLSFHKNKIFEKEEINSLSFLLKWKRH